MKYLSKIGISKKKIVPTGVLLTSIFFTNNELSANVQKQYTIWGYSNRLYTRSLLHDVSVLPKEYPNPKSYYSSFPDYKEHFIDVDVRAISSLPLTARANYITLSGVGKPGSMETTTAVNLDSHDGITAFKASVSGDISSSVNANRFIFLKETTVTGQNNTAISLTGNGSDTVMISYSKLGNETTTTHEFTNPKDSQDKYTVTIYSGTGGDINLNSGDNVLWIGGDIKEGFNWNVAQGYNGPSKIYGSILLGDGKNELVIGGRSEIFGNITIGNGDNSIDIEHATIGVIVKNPFTYEVVTVPGVTPNGSIQLGAGKNTVSLDRVEIAGSFKSSSGEDSIVIKSSSLYDELKVEGSGKNTIKIEHTTIYKGIDIAGDNNSIEIKGGLIGKPRPLGNDTAKDTYEDIKMGGTGNTLSLYYSDFGGQIEGQGTIQLHAGAGLIGDRTIKSGQDIYLYAASSLDGSIKLEDNSVTLHAYGGDINGTIGDASNLVGSIFIRHDKDSKDYVSSDMSIVRGDIYAQVLDIGSGANLLLQQLIVDANDTSNTIKPEDPIERTIKVKTLVLGGDIVLNSGKVKDKLAVEGTIDSKGGSFVLDMNFEDLTSDTLDLSSNSVAITNTSGGANSIVYFFPEKPLYYASIGSLLEGVVLGDSSLNIALSQTDVGGYEYELIRNPTKDQWDLRLVRISASNYAYAGIMENMRNYTRHVWGNINNQFMQTKVAQHASDLSVLPNVGSNKRVFEDFGLTTWVNTNYITNSIYDPEAPTIDEQTFVVSAGVSAETIEFDKDNEFAVHAFVAYGDTQSKLNQYERRHTMRMNALSLGSIAQWTYKGIGEQHSLITTTGVWGDFVGNTVNLEGLDQNTKWDTNSVKTVFSLGYQLEESGMIFLTALDTIYSFTKGVSFITRSNNAIDIEDDHQVFMRVNALIGYSFNFGLTPFLQFYTDVPLYASSDGLIRSNGYAFKYDSEDFSTAFNIGANYTMSFGQDNLKAYCIIGIHKGQPSTKVEVGFSASGGVSYTF